MLEKEEELFVKQATESDGGQGVFYYEKDKDFDKIIKMMN